jgi:hypothetical protein
VEFKRWIKVGSPNFILYTDASAAEASQSLRELEMLHLATQVFFGRKAIYLGPITVILPTASSDWRQLEAKGEVEWKVAVSTEAHEISDLIVVQYDWQDHGRSIVRAGQMDSEIERLNLRTPFWFRRGIKQFFETAEFGKNGVDLGRVNPRIWNLQHAKWIPWGRFFEVTGSSPEFTKENSIQLYSAQTSIFTHYLFTHADRSWIERLTKWVDYLNADHSPMETEFTAIFGQDWKKWQQTMERYVEGGSYRLYSVKLPPDMIRYTETKYTLPVREMRDLFVLTQVLVQSVPASSISLDSVLAQGLKTESLRELLVAACLKWKRKDEALTNLRQLIAAGSTNPRVYALAAAQIAPRKLRRDPLDVRFGPEVVEAKQWCGRALQIEPGFYDAGVMLAWLEALGPEVDQQGVTAIEELYLRMRDRQPANDLMMALAVALWRIGEHDTARELSATLKDDVLGTKHSRESAAALWERLKSKAETSVR